MKRLLFLFALFLFSICKQASATHIVGGELSYEYLGNNQYAITLVVYRDCLSGQAAFDDPAAIGIYDANGGLVQNLDFDLDSIITLQSTINSSCVTAPNDVCTEAGYYTSTVTLPPTIGGYSIAYQRCCRNAVVQNIQNPDDVGATYVATIPGSESSPANNSPFWNELPPLYVCVNLPFQFDHSAFDADGDSLVYSLCTPFEGGTPNGPSPDPPAPPPYTQVSWDPPYSLNNMLGGPDPMTIDPETGQINATPNSTGTFVIGLCVQEYRNGVLLGETRRGFQISVVNCQAPVAIPDDVNEITPNSFMNCTEYVEFDAINSSGFDIWWDFGDPTTGADQSTLQSPTWTYPGPGTYDMTLVVYNPINPNDPLCTDTVIQQITVRDTVNPDAGPDTATCAGIPVQIGSPAVSGWSYSWSPTTGLNDPNISNPIATVTGEITYYVTATDQVGCAGIDSVTVSLLANAAADAGPDVEICPGASTQLGASGGVDYLWSPNSFIDDVAISDPTVNPPTSTEYIVQVTNADGCIGFDTVLVNVLQPSLVVSNDTLICIGDTITLSVSGGVDYVWLPNYNISDINSSSPEVWPTQDTTYLVNATDANGCEVSDSVLVQVQELPVADAGVDQEICAGEVANLQASGGITYVWEPAGSLSDPNISSPVASPISTTEYSVVVSDPLGCSDSDTMEVTVNPLPDADAGPDQILCEGDIVQLSASGGVDYSWSPGVTLNDSLIADPIADPEVPTNYVVTVTDGNGCSDTDTVFVDVFTIDAFGDTIICIGDAAQLGVTGGVSWSWTPTNGLSDPASQFPTADPLTTIVYTVVADNGQQCFASDTVTVVVSPLPEAFAGFDQGVCAGSEAQLNATGGVIYVWSPSAGLSDPNIPDPVVTFSSDTVTYSVTVTDAIGCVNYDTVTVWQEPLPVATAAPDTIVCFGQSVPLIATGGTTYSWDPPAGLSNPNIFNPVATPLATTTYTVTVGQPTGNLVFNGDFSQGNVGFGSDYTYSNNLVPEATYGVATDASTLHPSFQGMGHTGNAPMDSFLVVNGAGTPNQNVWCQTLSVSPNTDYYFGAWVTTLVANSPAILQFSINGQTLGGTFNAPFNVNSWIEFSETWNSGTATTATICVVNQNTNTGGNDFGLDDITFSTICTNTAEVTVEVNPIPEANAGPDQAICIGDVTQLEGSGGGTYLWVPPLGLTDPTDPTTDASPNFTQNYTLIVTDNIGCQDTADMTLTVNPLPPADAGPSFEICEGESVVLQGSGGVGYVWTPGTYLDDPTSQLPVSTPEQTITYYLNVVDANLCANNDSVTVIVNELPFIEAGADSMICANSTIVLQASGGETYVWSPVVGLSDPQSATPSASPLNPIVYYVTGTDANGCVNTDSVSITIFAVTAWPDSVICLNDSVQAFVSGGATYDWTPASGVSDPTSGTPYLSPDASTTFTVTVTSEFGCEAQAEVDIDILTLPVAGFSVEFEPSCDGIFADFTNSSENSETFVWMLGDGTVTNEFEPTHTYPPGQGSVVTLIAYNNDSLCVDSVTLDYSGQWFGNDTIEIDYGNVFTPNFDNINDCFKPGFDGRFSECYNLKVYNRWGALLFESTGGQNHCWDGRTKAGKRCEEGTYYYIASLKGYEKHGYVTLVY